MVALRALSLSVPPGPGPADLLNNVRYPFCVHPPHSVARIVVWSHPNPKRAFCGGQRSVGEPAPQERTTGPGYRACKTWDRIYQHNYGAMKIDDPEAHLCCAVHINTI